MTDPRPAVLAIGLGNELRRDDGAGVEVARALRRVPVPAGAVIVEEQGEPTGLIDVWEGAGAVVIVDAMRSGAPPGSIRRLDASRARLPSSLGRSASTHALALGEALELARTLGRLPPRVIVHAVEGEDFGAGPGLSAAVRAAMPALTAAVLSELRALTDGD